MVYPVELNVQYSQRLSRLTTFFRIFLIIPQAVVIYFLIIAMGVTAFVAWWSVLFIGRYPRPLFNFMTWASRWNIRVGAYFNLLTDKYPPFNGDP